MKSLEEKKLLVKMARMLGQPVDQALVESIEREEKLVEAFFGEKKKEEPKIPILKEDVPSEIVEEPLPPQEEKPAETGVQPPEESKVAQVAAYLDTVQNLPQSKYRDAEMITYTWFYVDDKSGTLVSPFFDTEEEARAWCNQVFEGSDNQPVN